MPSNNVGDSTVDRGVTATKRRRVTLACTVCRLRKSKCDGDYPSCSSCKTQGIECSYDFNGEAGPASAREKVDAIDERLSRVEKQLALHADLLGPSSSSSAAPRSRQRPTEGPQTGAEGLGFGEGLNNGLNNGTTVIAGVAADTVESTATDGMGTTFVDEKDFAFYGPSSNTSFMRTMLHALHNSRSTMSATSPAETIWTEENILSTSRALHQAQNHSDLQVGTYTGPLRGSALVLPSKPEMEDMLSAFFGNTGLVFPFIHEMSFMSEYKKARASGFTHLRLSWLGLLNMIFAMMTSVNAPCNDGNAIFSSALILDAATVIDTHAATSTAGFGLLQNYRSYLRRACDCLGRLGGNPNMASRCANYISRLLIVIDADSSAGSGLGASEGGLLIPNDEMVRADINVDNLLDSFPGMNAFNIQDMADVDFALANFFHP
ncbi:fungal Zn(2)-Cys(6) binuclear cluster domain-containing protein 21 [Elsinoe australis]|uniref:Fungal Zn(2)-Cys(6) binuclear cluster domain-containing protein 21 n=1 Tax=Elsinoe australis TaxID=40998 RepID=A0A4U7ARI5_9PEZI|nr:fungal Zn(2)-Cys(6) binuclear cluster domain-containing protein 21 [Elsinoe australis]